MSLAGQPQQGASPSGPPTYIPLDVGVRRRIVWLTVWTAVIVTWAALGVVHLLVNDVEHVKTSTFSVGVNLGLAVSSVRHLRDRVTRLP